MTAQVALELVICAREFAKTLNVLHHLRLVMNTWTMANMDAVTTDARGATVFVKIIHAIFHQFVQIFMMMANALTHAIGAQRTDVSIMRQHAQPRVQTT
jgi:hypothetical protein